MSGKNSIQVAIKVRPLLRKEKDQQSSWRIVNNSIQLIDSQTDPYYFDHIFDQDVTNQIIFDKMAKQIVHSAIKGFNGTIFAYGQTSSGKTYTMMGDDDNPGVMVLAAKEIFKEIERTSDRQFLLRVGYIEIYNEKIYDLLNKKNHDLKIHETSTGIISVNCEECIIQCEDDLLNYLTQGTKERTVGETNMNERSSRSHAIFRIIIESRKIDRSDDDAIIQSVINLVDLAGSERADQTGARGTRLKEGGHINKSLLFLSTVIKRLSENEDDKYISFRDSKLTRILQASLGGNALTAIICTIKPNAVEETQSSLSFALRAKSIKNKPQVNEIVSDATMMKRLEHEIKVLKSRLEVEQRKNESQIKVRQLEHRIKMEDLKIISCSSLLTVRNREKRRRTWCLSSTNLDGSVDTSQSSALPVPLIPPPSRLQPPKKSYYNTPLITMRPTEPPPAPKSYGLPIPTDSLPEINEEFAPAELVNFEMLSPMNTPNHLHQRHLSLTPKVTATSKVTLEQVEHDLLELQSYTNLEKLEEVKHEPELALKQMIKSLSQRNAVLEDERLDYIKLKDDIVITSDNLIESEKRCDELQIQLSKLTNANSLANEKISKYEKELADLKLTNDKLEMENREAVNLDFEFQQHKHKSKLRENELLEALNEKDKEITKLEKSLASITSEKLHNSKEELLQLSLKQVGNSEEEGRRVCIKCEDLQRLLEENKKVISEFEKLTLEYEKLKLNYTGIEKENETNKLRIKQLEELQQTKNAECERLQSDVLSLKEKLQTVQTQYEQLSTENSSKHIECMALNSQVERARQEMVVLEEKFTKLEISWQEQQQTINDIELQYATIQTKYEQLQTQYEQLETTRGQSLTDCQRLEKENVELQTEIEDLKKKVQDAQQKLLANIEKSDEDSKEQKAAYDERSTEATTKSLQENENLKHQLSELRTVFDDLQKEYDDLSNQLMENIQDSDSLKQENSKLEEKLKSFEEKNAEVCKAEAEINVLKTQLENVLSSGRKSLLKTPSPCRNSSMRSSGVCVEEEEEDGDEDNEDVELLRKFCELSESLIEIELEHSTGKTKVFKSSSKKSSSTPNNYKLYLKNILGITKTQKNFDSEIEKIHLQGSFKHHSFHIVELTDEENSSSEMIQMACDASYTNDCDNVLDYIKKLKQEISELRTRNEHERQSNKSLLESTESAISELREQIQNLQSELMENQQQIVTLVKEKADITLMCEDLQEKVNCTLNGSISSLINITANIADLKCLPEEKLKDLENFKLREKQIIESFDSQTKMLEELSQKNNDMEYELEMAREQLETQSREHKEKCNQLQLEIIEKLELSADEYRDNMKKYNKEWEERRETYEQVIQELNKQLESFKKLQVYEQQKENNTVKGLKQQLADKEEHGNCEVQDQISHSDDNIADENKDGDNSDNFTPEEQIEYLRQQKVKLEEEKQSLMTRLSSIEEELENLQQESHIKINCLEEQLKDLNEEHLGRCQEQTLLDSRIISLEELLKDAQELHKSTIDEKAALETQVSDLQQDLNCIPLLHEKVHVLYSKKEELHAEYKQMQQKLQNAESQIQEFCKEDKTREEIVLTLQNKLSSLKCLEEEKEMLISNLESLQSNFTDLKDTLDKTQERESQIVQENESFKLENTGLKDKTEKLSNSYSELELEKSKLEEKLEKLSNSESELVLEKTKLVEKLQHISNEFELLKGEHESLETQLGHLIDEKKLLLEQKSVLNDAKTTLEEQLKCLNKKEEAEELLDQMIKEKAELSQNLRLTNEKLEEIEKERDIAKQEKIDLHQSLQTLQKEIEKEKDKSQQEKSELHRSLQTLQEDIENAKEKAKQEKQMLHQDLQTIQDSLSKTIQEKHEQRTELEQENLKLQTDFDTLKANLHQANQDLQEQLQQIKAAKQESSKLHHDLQMLKEEKQQQFSDLETYYKAAKEQNSELQNELQTLKGFLAKYNEEKQQHLSEKADQQQELSALKASLNKLNEDKENLQENLLRYQNLQEEKSQLQATINTLKSVQYGAVNNLQKERDTLQLTLQQYEHESQQFKEKEETLNHKIETLSQKLHEVSSKANNYEQLVREHEEAEQALTLATAANQKLQLQISELYSQQQQYVLNVETQSKQIDELHLELKKQKQEEEMLHKKFKHLKKTLEGEKSTLQREHQALQSCIVELRLKCESLEATQTQLQHLNLQLEQQIHETKESLSETKYLQDELNTLKAQHNELKIKMKETVEEAGRCSHSLREDLVHHKQLLEQQLERYTALRVEMENKEKSSIEENGKLLNKISGLQLEKQSLEDKIREITVRNFEQDLQRQACDAVAANASIDSNTSLSPRTRKSLERLGAGVEMKATNLSIEEKLTAIQQKNSTERRNRRLSTYDERRRQSYWGVAHDKETMTNPVDTNCNCVELDRKLKECERSLFIKSSQVTALNMELKNHPLKDENAILMKRLQEEQDKSRIEIKRCKQKLYEQTAKAEKAIAAAAHATAKCTHAAAVAADVATSTIPKVMANIEVQTDCDLNSYIQKLQGKYNDLKNICRYRHNLIKELEGKVSGKENSDGNTLSALEAAEFRLLNTQNESLKKELKTLKEKYEYAKGVLTSRREEIKKLRAQLCQTQA